jgi:benzodiazapine receptor
MRQLTHESAPASWGALVVVLIVCLGVMAFGGLVTQPALAAWYAGLRKPVWTPPAWIFGPVWTVLYITMAVAAWLVWRHRREAAVALPIGLFVVQLVLNAAWSPLFFGRRDPLLALVDIGLLWVSIGLTLIAFWRVARAAGWLMLPYLIWVTYAAGLNLAIWRLNG